MHRSTAVAGRDGMLAAAVLALYLGSIHLAALAFDLPSAQLASVSAIVILNVLIAVELWNVRRGLTHAAGTPGRGPAVLVCGGLALAALAAVAALHADYLVARARGANYGMFNTATLKGLLTLSQLAFLFFAAAARGRGARTWRALFAIDRADLALFALVLVPLVNYFARNRESFTALSALQYFGTLAAFAVLVAMLAVAYQRLIGARPFALPMVVALVFIQYSMPMVAALLQRPIEFLFWVQLALAIVLPAVMAAVYLANPPALRLFVLLFAASSAAGSFFMAPAVADIDRRTAADALAAAPPDALKRALEAPVRRRPGVYLMVYDSYAPRPMMARYGIDNTKADAFLERHGFTSYDEAYSLFHATYRGMSALMNMTPPPGAGIGGVSTVTEFFRTHGYKTHLVLHSYLLNGNTPLGADFTFPSGYQRSALGTLYRGIAGGEFKSQTVFQDVPHDEWTAIKRQVIAAREDQPKMVYAHSGLPGHSQNSGRCLADETERYAERLSRANAEMEADITAIVAADPGAIIIVAGDHGPYLTGDCLYMQRTPASELTAAHLADRYGAKLAIRWPGTPSPAAAPVTIQDVFFAIAAFLLDDDAVLRHRLPRVTSGHVGLPDGAVQDGIVMIGRDKGRPLFFEAR